MSKVPLYSGWPEPSKKDENVHVHLMGMVTHT